MGRDCGPPLKHGQAFEMGIDALAPGGDGVGSVDGYRVFVPQAAPGDRLLVRAVEVRSSFARARIVKVLAPGGSRIEPPCPVAGDCGGCAWQHLGYPSQALAKEGFVRETLRRLGKFADPPVSPILAAPSPLGYRNKAQVPVGLAADGALLVGYYRAGSHEIVALPEEGCRLVEPAVNAALCFARDHFPELGLAPFDERSRQGSLRHLLARANRAGETMLALVTAAPMDAAAAGKASKWMGRAPGLMSLLNNIQPSGGNVILGPETRLLAGEAWLGEELGGLRYRLSAQSFFQVNPAQALALQRTVLGCRVWSGKERVLELYCGVGTLSLPLAKACGELLGVEELAAAVEDARANASLNGVASARFEAADAAAWTAHWRGSAPDLVVLDPPRKGLSEAVRASLKQASPSEIIYISCDPASLARDLAEIVGAAYRLESVRPLDLFPQTPHVECVARLVKGGA